MASSLFFLDIKLPEAADGIPVEWFCWRSTSGLLDAVDGEDVDAGALVAVAEDEDVVDTVEDEMARSRL